MKRLSIDVDDEIYERLRTMNYITHVSMAEIVRNALKEYLAPIPEAAK